jgi:hypothetical protein
MANKTDQIADYKPPTGRIGRMVLNPLSRLFHGNAAGYDNNTRPVQKLRDLQRNSAATLGQVPKTAQTEQLKREGYLALTPTYDRAVLDASVSKARSVFEDPSAYRAVGRYEWKSQRIVPHPERRVPELAQLITPAISDIIRSYFGAHFEVEMIRLWRNYPVPPEQSHLDHYSNLWHNDYDLVTRLRYFVLLTDDVTRETGAMALWPISRTRRIMRSGYVRRDAIYGPARGLVEEDSDAVFYTGNIGSAFFFNPQRCLHRASVPKTGVHRDIVQFTFLPAARPMPSDWAAHLPDDPELAG